MNYTQLASEELLARAKSALKKNGFIVFVAEDENEAKEQVLNTIPKGSSVLTNSSKTLEAIGVKEIIDESGEYNSVHKALLAMNRSEEGVMKRQMEMRSVPEYATGSVHAITSDGHLILASGSGSQIPGYAFGAEHVVIVAGTHKIVEDIAGGIKRIQEHSWPLEDERMKSVGYPGSNIRRILIMNSESAPRTTVILVKKVIGF